MDSFECISAMQKCIRRGLEREAMHFAMEMCMTSKAFFSRVVNRLFIIAHEDIGLADMQAVQFATVALGEARNHYDTDRPGKYALAIGNAIRALCRANKSREGDWFAIVLIQHVKHGIAPELQDWMLDMHTRRGKALGRGIEHFLEEGCRLDPQPERPEPYEEEATKWLREHGMARTPGGARRGSPKPPSLFEDDGDE